MNHIPKEERTRHQRILKETLKNDKFEGIHAKTEFRDPALLCVFKKQPSKHAFNTLSNTLNLEIDEELVNKGYVYLYLYFQDTKSGFRMGLIRENIEDIYMVSELFEKYKMKMLSSKNGERVEVTPSDYITTMIW